MQNPRWRRTLYSAWIAQLASMTAFSFVWPFTPFYLRELGVTDESALPVWTGLVHSATGFTLVFSAPLWGVIADRFGRKPMVMRAMFAGAAVLWLMGRASGPYEFLVLRLAQGAFTGTVAASVALVASTTPVEHTGYSLGLMQAAVFAGIGLGPYIGGRIAGKFGYRPAFAAGAVLLLVAGVFVAIFAEERFERKAEGRRVGIGQVFLMPGFLALILVAFGVQFANSLVSVVFSLFVERLAVGGPGVVAVKTGEIIALGGVAAAASAACARKLSDRIGYKTNLAACCILSGAFIALQGAARSLGSLTVLRIAFGIATGGLMPALNSLIKLLVPEEAHGRAFGLKSGASYVGFAVGSMTGGLIAGSRGLGAPFFLTGALLLVVGLWTVAAVRPEASRPA